MEGSKRNKPSAKKKITAARIIDSDGTSNSSATDVSYGLPTFPTRRLEPTSDS